MATVTICTDDGRTVNAKLEEWIGALLMTLTPKTTSEVLLNLDKLQKSKAAIIAPNPLHTRLLEQYVKSQGQDKTIVLNHG